MKSLLRMAGTIVLAALLLSCGGGVDERDQAVQSDRASALSIDSCTDEILVIGVGPGTETVATDDLPDPPDFVVKKVWLQTPWGTEAYKFGLGENFDTKAQSANIGDGSCPTQTGEPTTITGHFYLSKGYKEDVHSGDGAWRRIDSTTTQCSSLLPGDTHTETKNTVISQWITTPGIYNIVYCIDHPLDDHNNGGEHHEKHESNNCSTEAVFEVTANQVENVPDVDFTVSSFTVLQAPVYAGDYIRLGASITNAGAVNATTDIRSSYTVSCNGGPTSLLTDDGTMASTLTAGASAWEEIQTPVLMPNVVGICTLTFTADYLGAQAETDETNNSTSLTVTLAPRPPPMPDFVVTAVGPAGGSASIKAGTRFYPAMYVKNIGTAASPAAIRSSYWFMGPGTGGVWTYITDDGTEASRLCVGCEEREQYDSGMKISVRGTYYFKGCADYQGAVTESNEANNCTVSSPITVY
ncbi:MAG: CARDB domain-containing protein [Undibacterium sp.]